MKRFHAAETLGFSSFSHLTETKTTDTLPTKPFAVVLQGHHHFSQENTC